jgi:hypothetical protein
MAKKLAPFLHKLESFKILVVEESEKVKGMVVEYAARILFGLFLYQGGHSGR